MLASRHNLQHFPHPSLGGKNSSEISDKKRLYNCNNGTITSSSNRIAGDNPGTTASVSLAVISAGPDGVFNTTCANLKSWTINGDDIARLLDVEQVKQAVNGTLYFGDPVADTTALSAVPTGSLLDGHMRLKKSDNTLWRWNTSTSAWQQVSLGPAQPPNHNYLINGNFDIWQRGTTFSAISANTGAYTADRWQVGNGVSNGNLTPSQVTIAGTSGAPAGANYAIQLAPGSPYTNPVWLKQKIEELRTFSGQTMTVSFWARCTVSCNNSMQPAFEVNYGSGGTATAWIYGSGQNLTTTWTRYSQQLAVPGITGSNTVGAGSYLGLFFNISGSGAVQVAQVQLESGSSMTPFEFRPLAFQLLLCQRYYLDHTGNIASDQMKVYLPSNATSYRSWMFTAEMRTTPTIKSLSALSGQSAVTSGPTQVAVSSQGVSFSWVATNTAGMYTLGANWAADAEIP